MIDVIIVGGGPAGSAMGCYLSKMGISNVIFEGANHPRVHVGESMVTSSTRVFQELGFLETMEREGFVHKYGASWHPILGGHEAWHTGQEASIEFAEFPQPGVNQDYTYHVDRSKFDLLLLKHAESLGSKVVQGATVTKVLFEGNKACGVRVRIADQEIDFHARMVVDASGRGTLLGRQLRLKKNDPIFDQYAVHAWFKNVSKAGPTADFIHIYFLPVERGWAWQIPITEEITSIGIVAEREVFRRAHTDVETYFLRYVESNADLAAAMSTASRINDFRVEGDYSYSMEKFVGDGFLMVGDAARFVDPIFSSGVSVALYSAKFASETIEKALGSNDVRAEALMPYETKLRKGVTIWYEFIRLYYKLLPLFTYFISSSKYRLQVLQLLQGEVFDRESVPVLDEMRAFIERVEKTDNHLFKSQLSAIEI
ncbi:MAG TPA: NAD(P)/FAD-dependent oxidoreductase [Candidatus Binatia bacterium]|jgi:FADH2 O2-dependent halogenase|nr:NAD(P)/FAD-dependent oxidoreductase [Candidatus Binatia bacterium]